MKIIAFTFSGGNKYSYQTIIRKNPNFITLEYPGRGKRFNEPLLEDMDILLDDLIIQIEKVVLDEDDYIIYGHCMGALIAFLLCKRLENLSFKNPLKLIVSGSKVASEYKMVSTRELEKVEFWNEIYDLGVLPKEVFKHEKMKTYLEPSIRADFECVEQFRYKDDFQKLSIPIDVFYGSREGISLEDAKAWDLESREAITINKLEGDHFFIFDHLAYFKEYFEALIETK